jgi:hypothetical protein
MASGEAVVHHPKMGDEPVEGAPVSSCCSGMSSRNVSILIVSCNNKSTMNLSSLADSFYEICGWILAHRGLGQTSIGNNKISEAEGVRLTNGSVCRDRAWPE